MVYSLPVGSIQTIQTSRGNNLCTYSAKKKIVHVIGKYLQSGGEYKFIINVEFHGFFTLCLQSSWWNSAQFDNNITVGEVHHNTGRVCKKTPEVGKLGC